MMQFDFHGTELEPPALSERLGYEGERYWFCAHFFLCMYQRAHLSVDIYSVALLLHKFRIQYASITVVTDICKRPEAERYDAILFYFNNYHI